MPPTKKTKSIRRNPKQTNHVLEPVSYLDESFKKLSCGPTQEKDFTCFRCCHCN